MAVRVKEELQDLSRSVFCKWNIVNKGKIKGFSAHMESEKK